MKRRSGFYSGATAPESHRLLRFISKTNVTLLLAISGCQAPIDPMSASRLTLISHAATEAQRRSAFPIDEPVMEREITKISGLNWRAPSTALVWCGPEQRTQQTSRILGLSVMIADGLRDCDYGRWRGRKMDEVQAEDQEGLLAWLSDPTAAPHGGESLESLVVRVGIWMDEQRIAKHTIAVTHPAIVRAAVVHALRIPPQIFWRVDVEPFTMTDLRCHNNVWTLRSLGSSLRKATLKEEAEI
jgi:broad specificity phosphatase PhoE